MARLDRNDLAAIRWLLGQLLVLIALAGGRSVDLGSDWIITAGLVLAGTTLVLPGLAGRIPRLFWRSAPPVMLVAIVSDFFLSGGDVLPPLFRMVVLLALFRTLQPRTPREDLQLLLLALFLILLTGVLSQEITFGLQMLLFAPLAMGLLFVANLSAREPEEPAGGADAPGFDGFSWRGLWRRARSRADQRTLALGSVLFLLTAGMGLLFFLLLPRFDIGQALPFLRLHTGRSLTGFTDHVRYGDVVSILNDDTMAMRVDVEMDDPPARPYWRMVVLDGYYDGGFRVSPSVERDRRPVNHHRFEMDEMPAAARAASIWTVYLEGGVSAYLPAGDTFATLRFRNRIRLDYHERTRVLRTAETNATTLSLRYEGLQFGGAVPAGAGAAALRTLRPLAVDARGDGYLREMAWPQTLLAFPAGDANRDILQRTLAAVGFVPGMAAAEFAERLVAHLQAGRSYSLDSRIPEGGADTLLRWLDSDAPGHCELFAGAFVLVSRYAGYPAALVAGFAGGDWNGYENYFMVRNRHAHAWCEIFDPQRGWVRVDPTPGSVADAGPLEQALASGALLLDRTWQARLDSLRILWFRRVIQFDSGDQEAIAEAARSASLRAADWLRRGWAGLRAGLARDWPALLRAGDWRGVGSGLLFPAAAGVLGAGLALLVRRRRRLTRNGRLRLRAGRLLARAGRLDTPAAAAWHPWLQRFRYGPEAAWPERPEPELRRAGRELARSSFRLPTPP